MNFFLFVLTKIHYDIILPSQNLIFLKLMSKLKQQYLLLVI